MQFLVLWLLSTILFFQVLIIEHLGIPMARRREILGAATTFVIIVAAISYFWNHGLSWLNP